MSYFDDSRSLNDPSIERAEREHILMDRIRRFAIALVEDGAHPPDVTYGLSYIATEMGLRLSRNSYRAFPFILAGASDAGMDAIKIEKLLRDREGSAESAPTVN